MRFAACLLAISVALFAAALARSDEPAKPAFPAPPKVRAGDALERHYTVHCRWIDSAREDDALAFPLVVFPPATVSDGERKSISEIVPFSVAIGVGRWTEPKTHISCPEPLSTTIDPGVRVDLVVAGRAHDGVIVDATVELSTIEDFAAKKIISESAYGGKTTIEIPKVTIVKKRTIDFVKFGETFVVPMSEKLADGTTARLEIVVNAPKDK